MSIIKSKTTEPSPNDVVITGMSGQFPNSHNIKEYIDQILNKVHLCDNDERRGKIYRPEIPKLFGKVYDMDQFDMGNFGIHSLHSMYMDPMGRLLLEQVYSALFDAGIHPGELKGTRTGTFTGSTLTEYEQCFYRDLKKDSYMIAGVTKSMNAQRVNYCLQVNGPAYNCDTACGSSMYALDEAYRAIREGRCDRAIVGGTNLCLDPHIFIQFSRMGLLNSGGGCRPFDNDANGYTRSEAIVAIILQKRSEAKRIYGTLAHVKTNEDGFKQMGITSPSCKGHLQLLKDVYSEAEIDPKQIGYFEAHGTGTHAGDLSELNAINQLFKPSKEEPLLIGSVKGNIGHCEGSSGLCSLVKVMYALNLGHIPPNIHFDKPRADVEALVDGRLKVVTDVTLFPEDKLYAGISCYGFGGANAHAIIRKYDEVKPMHGIQGCRLICYSGRTQEALNAIHENIVNCKDIEFLCLLQESFKINYDTHLYRGFTIVGRNLRSSIKSTYSENNKIKLIIGNFKNDQIIDQLIKIPIFKTFLTKNEKNLIRVPKETIIFLMILHSFKELEVPVHVFENKNTNAIKKYFNNELSILELSKIISTKPQLESNQRVDKWIKKNSVYSTGGTIIILGTSYFNTYFKKYTNQKCNFVEFGDDLTEERFLCNCGKLYQLGFNLQVHKLYSAITFPVSRGTDYMSYILKWHHKTVPCLKLEKISRFDAERIDRIDIKEKELVYLKGNMIDDRNVFPASGYIYHVWKLFADSKGVYPDSLSIVLENVKFHRACTITNNPLELYIVITNSGNFEVSKNGTTVVTGRISTLNENINHDVIETTANGEIKMNDFKLTAQEAYRELRLRGYNYSGQFRAIQEVTQTSATIKWDREWITFLDNMMQVYLFKFNARHLYVPVGIENLVIYAKEHIEHVNIMDNQMVAVDYQVDRICSKFIEFRGIRWKSIVLQEERLQPVLESYQFVPNEFTTNLATSIRINIQLLLECKWCDSLNVAELVEDDDESDDVISNHIFNAILDFPMVTPNLTVVTTREDFEVPNCNTVKHLPEQNLLIVCKDLKNLIFTDVDKALSHDGFLLCLAESQQIFPENYIILTKHINNMSTKEEDKSSKILYFLRKRLQNKASSTIMNVSNSSNNMSWLKDVQIAVRTSSDLVLLAQNDHTNGILGLTKCLNREPGMDNVSCVFIQDKSVQFDENNKKSVDILEKQLGKQMKINVFKNGQWGTYRHLSLGNSNKAISNHWYAKTMKTGNLSSLKWVQGHLTSRKEESYKILYSALNCNDLLAAYGKQSNQTSHNALFPDDGQGFEFVGIDPRGKRVCAIGQSTLANMTDNVYLTYEIPDNWKTEDAATVLTAYSTVLLGLIEKAKLQKGQSVLIHSGSDDVGLAAINVCTYFECNIFVTVNTKEKRDYLIEYYPNIKASQIGNIQNMTLKEMIIHDTNGNGVDVVLSSLSGEQLQTSVDCLAFGGVFLQLCKVNLKQNTELFLELATKECRYIGLMFDSCVYQDNPTIVEQLLRDGFRDGYIKPLPRTVFQMDEIKKAYKFLNTNKHIGKMLIKIDHEREHKVLPRYYCDPTKCYVIFGGLGGFGLELADWLISRGARHIVLFSRRGITTGYQRYRISIWSSYGVSILTPTDDVTNFDICRKVLKNIHNSVPIDGIFNLALVLKDAVFENQTIETMNLCMQPKAILTQHLDTLTRVICPNLKSFVVFSSMTSGRGNAGQTNYGYTNSVMERICEQRHLDGLPALAIQWGAIGDVGILEQFQRENNAFTVAGTLQQKIRSCLEVLDKLLMQINPIVSSVVIAEKFNKRVSDSLLENILQILGIHDVKSVSAYATFPELGMDSLILVEIKQILEKQLGISLLPDTIRNLTLAKLEDITSGVKTLQELS